MALTVTLKALDALKHIFHSDVIIIDYEGSLFMWEERRRSMFINDYILFLLRAQLDCWKGRYTHCLVSTRALVLNQTTENFQEMPSLVCGCSATSNVAVNISSHK